MQITPAGLDGVLLVQPTRHGDDRGYFAETWRPADLAAAGYDVRVAQENESLSAQKGTVRGLHYQIGPNAQAKLVRVAQGAVIDVAVDIRVGSPTFGHHVAVELSASSGEQLAIPAGFAHAFCTIEPNTLVLYKASMPYDPAAERAIRWNDPALGIPWPVDDADATVSDKDRAAPLLADQTDLPTWSMTPDQTA